MVNRWVEFIRKWSKDNDVSYGCALTMPQLKTDYYKEFPKKLTKKQRKEMKDTPFEALEEALPSTEAKSKNITIKKDSKVVRVKRKTIDGVKYLLSNQDNKLYSEFKTDEYDKNEEVGYWDEKTKTIEPLRDEDYEDYEGAGRKGLHLSGGNHYITTRFLHPFAMN